MTPELQAEIAKTLAFDHGGSQSPSEDSKHKVILHYAQKYRCNTLMETGTNRGDTIEATKHYFADIYSIELGPILYAAAKDRFGTDNNVHLIWGDAGDILGPFLRFADEAQRVIFYLDAHSRYDETSPAGHGIGTSAMPELAAIAVHRPDSVVLIDDARLFTHQFNTTWPELTSTIEHIESLGIWNIELKDDMIRLVPKSWDSSE
jgi:hypothetical protein